MLLILVIICSALTASHAVDSPLSDISQLGFSDDARLSTHWLLFSHSQCSDKQKFIDHVYRDVDAHRKIAAVTGDLEALLIPTNHVNPVSNENFGCSVVLLERGTSIDRVAYHLPEQTFHLNAAMDFTGYMGMGSEASKTAHLSEFIRKSNQAEIGWVSYMIGTGDIYFVTDKGERKYSGELKYGEKNTVWLHSFLGHKFEIVNQENKEIWWRNFNPDGSGDHNENGVRYNCYFRIGDSGSGNVVHHLITCMLRYVVLTVCVLCITSLFCNQVLVCKVKLTLQREYTH